VGRQWFHTFWRHCERSEATQKRPIQRLPLLGCFVAYAPRNDEFCFEATAHPHFFAPKKISPVVSGPLDPHLGSISRIASGQTMATKRKDAPAAAKPRAVKKAAPKKPAAPVMPKRKPDEAGIDWDRIRADYEIGARKLVAIAQEHGIYWQKISARAKRDGWPRLAEVKAGAGRAEPQEPEKGGALPVDAEALAGRLIKLIAREIADVEAQRKVTRDEALGERQARRLASLVRSADKLHEIEQAARQAKKNDPESDRAKRREEVQRICAEFDRRFAHFLDVARARRDQEKAERGRETGVQ